MIQGRICKRDWKPLATQHSGHSKAATDSTRDRLCSKLRPACVLRSVPGAYVREQRVTRKRWRQLRCARPMAWSCHSCRAMIAAQSPAPPLDLWADTFLAQRPAPLAAARPPASRARPPPAASHTCTPLRKDGLTLPTKSDVAMVSMAYPWSTIIPLGQPSSTNLG